MVLLCTTCSRYWPQIPTFSPVSDLLQGFKRTTVVMPRDAKAYVASKKSETSDLELAQEWAEIEELYSKRYFCGLFLYSSITNVGGGDPTLLLSEICAVIQYIQVILCKKEYT